MASDCGCLRGRQPPRPGLCGWRRGGERRPRWGAARKRGGIEVERRPRRLGRHTVPRCGGRRPVFSRALRPAESQALHRCGIGAVDLDIPGRGAHYFVPVNGWNASIEPRPDGESSARTPQYRERLLRRGFRPPRNRLRLENYPRQRPRSGPDDSSGYQSSRGTRPTMRPRPAHTSARAVPSRAKGFSAVPAPGIGCS